MGKMKSSLQPENIKDSPEKMGRIPCFHRAEAVLGFEIKGFGP